MDNAPSELFDLFVVLNILIIYKHEKQA